MLAILIGMTMLWTCHPSPSGRWLRRALVERPAEGLSRVKASHIAVVLLSLIAVAGAFYFFEGEGVRVIGASVAEGAAWFIAFDVGTFIEAYAVLWLLGATRQSRAALEYIRDRVGLAARVMRRSWPGRARQTARAVRRDPPSQDNDPDPEGWLAVAA